MAGRGRFPLADPLVLMPCGEGEIDLRTALECLLEDGYEGFISGEWINAPETIDLAEEISRLKQIEAQLVSPVADKVS